MQHETNETLRKSIHIAAGFGVIALHYFTWQICAVVALAATFSNWLLLHRLFGRGVARHERGWDGGIVVYPLCVLILILIFQQHSIFIAIPWTILAFADGFATLAGKRFPIRPLPWNANKSLGGSLTFLVVGIAAAVATSVYFDYDKLAVAIAAAIVAAIVESLPLGVNDNITVPFAAATTLAVFGTATFPLHDAPPNMWGWIAANTVLAIIGYALRGVNLSGLITGWLLGTIIIVGTGIALYLPLLAFFIIGTLVTKLGYKRKSHAGLAQEGGGRRGAGHAFANVGVAALCAIAVWRGHEILPVLMGVAALATAACDTTGSEIGQLFGRRAFLATTFKRVEPGTEGALSIEGTLAGIVAAAVVAIIGVAATVHHYHPGFMGSVVIARSRTVAVITACAFLGSYAESLAGNWNRKHGGEIPNGVLNFFNTVMGALLFYAASRFIPTYGFTL
jgi:uncharacterized protein (TIGR00297 family)